MWLTADQDYQHHSAPRMGLMDKKHTTAQKHFPLSLLLARFSGRTEEAEAGEVILFAVGRQPRTTDGHVLFIMKVTIKKWNAVATWGWDLPEEDVCGICQVHFDGTCPTCKYPGDDCTLRTQFLPISSRATLTHRLLVSGKCGHNFHMVRRDHGVLCGTTKKLIPLALHF